MELNKLATCLKKEIKRYLFLQINCKFRSFLLVEEGFNRTCGAIDEPSRSSKAIYKRVIIIFRDKNVVNARFATKIMSGFL